MNVPLLVELLGTTSNFSHSQGLCLCSSVSHSLTQYKVWTSCDGWTWSGRALFSSVIAGMALSSRPPNDISVGRMKNTGWQKKYGVHSCSCSHPAMNCQVTGNSNLSVPVSQLTVDKQQRNNGEGTGENSFFRLRSWAEVKEFISMDSPHSTSKNRHSCRGMNTPTHKYRHTLLLRLTANHEQSAPGRKHIYSIPYFLSIVIHSWLKDKAAHLLYCYNPLRIVHNQGTCHLDMQINTCATMKLSQRLKLLIRLVDSKSNLNNLMRQLTSAWCYSSMIIKHRLPSVCFPFVAGIWECSIIIRHPRAERNARSSSHTGCQQATSAR